MSQNILNWFHFQTTNTRIVRLHQTLKLTFILFFAEKWVRTGGNGRSQRCRRWLHQSRFTQSRGKRWKRSQWKKEKESMFELQEKSRLDRYVKNNKPNYIQLNSSEFNGKLFGVVDKISIYLFICFIKKNSSIC